MHIHTRVLLTGAAVLIAAVALVPADASAVWPHDPNVGNVPICVAGGDQDSVGIITDGAGGVIVTWADHRDAMYRIYAQRVSASGQVQWSAGGVALCTERFAGSPAIASDGAGGEIVSWADGRSGVFGIYAQRVDATGQLQWPAGGVTLSTELLATSPAIVPDGDGGAIVSWVDFRGGSLGVYAQRVDAAGVTQWTTGGVATGLSVFNWPSGPKAVADGRGGAVITSLNGPLRAQRVDAAGIMQWPAGGAIVSTTPSNQWSAIPDGTGGIIATWADGRNGILEIDIYAQRVSAAGAVQWADGVPLCTAPGMQIAPAIVTDGLGGAIVVWLDNLVGAFDIYGQRVNSAGVVQWTVDGVALCVGTGTISGPSVMADGAQGAALTWGDWRTGSLDIYAQRVNSTGVVQWTVNGVAICTAVDRQESPAIVPDGGGGAILAWQDRRSGDYDIYGQRLDRFGYLGAPEPVIASVSDVPNDQGGRVKLAWHASWLDAAQDPNLDAYDVYRSAPGSLVKAAVGRGARILSSFAERAPEGERAFVLDPAAPLLYAWEFLASFPVTHFLDVYGYLASTTCDSIGGSNPLTAFMVVGRNSDGTMFWLSQPDSGYSVDNLAPGVPAFLASRYVAGTIQVRWQPNPEPDLAEYRLYRGADADFEPGPATLVAAQPDTGYSDTGASPYSWYKLMVVDAHGNESAVAPLSPQQITGVAEDQAPPAVTELLGATPNPFNPSTTISFRLSRPARVRLAVFDAAGREVRVLLDQERPAGNYAVQWDGRTDQGRQAPSGIYMCRMEAEGHRETKRLALVK